MSLVFADSFYFIARLNRRDQHHEKAVRFFRSPDMHLLTSEWILVEVADGLAKSEVRPRLREIIDDLRQSSLCEIVPVSTALFNRALDLYHERTDKQWTLTDCTSFLIMQERGIKEALTGDRHFEQAGFTALLK
jgi:predicted nucleic acid-binding protein